MGIRTKLSSMGTTINKEPIAYAYVENVLSMYGTPPMDRGRRLDIGNNIYQSGGVETVDTVQFIEDFNNNLFITRWGGPSGNHTKIPIDNHNINIQYTTNQDGTLNLSCSSLDVWTDGTTVTVGTNRNPSTYITFTLAAQNLSDKDIIGCCGVEYSPTFAYRGSGLGGYCVLHIGTLHQYSISYDGGLSQPPTFQDFANNWNNNKFEIEGQVVDINNEGIICNWNPTNNRLTFYTTNRDLVDTVIWLQDSGSTIFVQATLKYTNKFVLYEG